MNTETLVSVLGSILVSASMVAFAVAAVRARRKYDRDMVEFGKTLDKMYPHRTR